MSYTYRLVTNSGSILPAAYPITATASQTGAGTLTRSFSITVTGVLPSADQMRTVDELLTVIWRDGQAFRQLTTQDCRETVLSLALQTADFSRLPRSTVGLDAGRAWVDTDGTIRVNI